jgi:hypothetical protein
MLLIVPAVAIVGCGGSSSLSASDLVSKANAICADVNTKAAADTKAQNVDKLVSDGEAALKQLKALKPPSSSKANYEAFIAELDASLPQIKALAAAIDAKDVAKVQALSPGVETANKKVNAAATTAGLTTCAESN